jgi:hypothetical protein
MILTRSCCVSVRLGTYPVGTKLAASPFVTPIKSSGLYWVSSRQSPPPCNQGQSPEPLLQTVLSAFGTQSWR